MNSLKTFSFSRTALPVLALLVASAAPALNTPVTAQTVTVKKDSSKAKKIGPPLIGKYGCTESRFNISSGYIEYEMRGSFTLAANGTYNYPGMKSSGRYAYDAKTDSIRFKGGYFNGATATYLDGKKKLRLEFPPSNGRSRRWSCGYVGKK